MKNSTQKIRIYNVFGRLIKQEELELNQSEAKMDVSELDSGYYILQFNSPEGLHTERFFVFR